MSLFVPKGFEMRLAGKAKFYTEDLFFLPRETSLTDHRIDKIVNLDKICDEVFTTAGEGCGLASSLREMFRTAGYEFRQYAGQAVSYSVLEDWASLGIGATILPRSKISKNSSNARALFLEGKPASITLKLSGTSK
jgi:hypothetical protein